MTIASMWAVGLSTSTDGKCMVAFQWGPNSFSIDPQTARLMGSMLIDLADRISPVDPDAGQAEVQS